MNRYTYAHNNPVRYSDPTGHWVETAVDLGFITYDVSELQKNPKSVENWLALVADVVMVAIPIATGGGMLVRNSDNIAVVVKNAAKKSKGWFSSKIDDIAKWGSSLFEKSGSSDDVIKGIGNSVDEVIEVVDDLTPINRGVSRPPKTTTLNSIYEQLNPDGTVESRAFYDSNGNQFSRQDFDQSHYIKELQDYYQPHEHNYKFNDNGLPNGRYDIPLPDGYNNIPTN